MNNELVHVHTAEGPMPALEFRPAGHPKGAVFVFQEAFGLTDHIADVCRRFANEGWFAIAPALFHRQGSPVFDYRDLPNAQECVRQLNPHTLRDDIIATLAYLELHGFEDEHIASVGFCVGGVFSFYASTIRKLGAAVTFYGSGIREGRAGLPPLLELVPSMRSPWLGLYGDQDSAIPAEQVDELHEAVKNGHVHTEVVRYPDAGHGFHCDARPEHFHAGSAADSWSRTLIWLETYVEPLPRPPHLEPNA